MLRFDLPEGKQIVPLTYCRNKKGETTWRWQGLPEPRPLYHLDKLAANPQATVIICEGEKVADACSELFPDCVTTTTLNGAQAPHKADFTPLAGRVIWLWPDNDAPGRKYADNTARLCMDAGVKDVQIMEILGDHSEGWDAANALDEGWKPLAGETYNLHAVGDAQEPRAGTYTADPRSQRQDSETIARWRSCRSRSMRAGVRMKLKS